MRIKILGVLIVAMLLLIGCSDAMQSGARSDEFEAAPRADVASEESAASGDFDSSESFARSDLQQVERLVIKSGNLSIEVESVDEAVESMLSLAVGLGGYVISQEVSGSSSFRSATVTVAVPAAQFENVIAELRDLGEVGSESLSGEDVTEEYIDLNSRLENLQATQQRLRELYEEARNVEETLEVDRELRRIEEEINVIQGRVNYLSERAAFSTVTTRFSAEQDAPVPEPQGWNLARTIDRAFVDLQDAAQVFTEGAIYFGIVCGPWLLLLLLLLWIVGSIVRRVRRRRSNNAAPSVVSTPAPPASSSDDSV